jgi:hypothetical protein
MGGDAVWKNSQIGKRFSEAIDIARISSVARFAK